MVLLAAPCAGSEPFPAASPPALGARSERELGHTDHMTSRVQHRPARRLRAAVTVRSMSSPRPGWSLPDAVRLAEQGYSLEQVERLTGYVTAHVKAQLARV